MSDLGVAIDAGVVDIKGQLATVLKSLGLDVMGDKSLLLDGNRSEQQPAAVGMLQQILDKLEAIASGTISTVSPAAAEQIDKLPEAKIIIACAHRLRSATDQQQHKGSYDQRNADDNLDGAQADCLGSARNIRSDVVVNLNGRVNVRIRLMDFFGGGPAGTNNTLTAAQLREACLFWIDFMNEFFSSANSFNYILTTYQIHTIFTGLGINNEQMVDP